MHSYHLGHKVASWLDIPLETVDWQLVWLNCSSMQKMEFREQRHDVRIQALETDEGCDASVSYWRYKDGKFWLSCWRVHWIARRQIQLYRRVHLCPEPVWIKSYVAGRGENFIAERFVSVAASVTMSSSSLRLLPVPVGSEALVPAARLRSRSESDLYWMFLENTKNAIATVPTKHAPIAIETKIMIFWGQSYMVHKLWLTSSLVLQRVNGEGWAD